MHKIATLDKSLVEAKMGWIIRTMLTPEIRT